MIIYIKHSLAIVSFFYLSTFFLAVLISSNFFLKFAPPTYPIGGAPPPTESPKYAGEVHYTGAGFELAQSPLLCDRVTLEGGLLRGIIPLKDVLPGIIEGRNEGD